MSRVFEKILETILTRLNRWAIIIAELLKRGVIKIAGLVNARIAAGLSQVEAARKLGVTQGTISQWEKGTSLPRADKLPEIAKLYGCTVDELFGEAKATSED